MVRVHPRDHAGEGSHTPQERGDNGAAAAQVAATATGSDREADTGSCPEEEATMANRERASGRRHS
jgi:hypothetical protein